MSWQHTAETKERLRQRSLGNKNSLGSTRTLSPETREKMSISRMGRKHSEETRKKISESHGGRNKKYGTPEYYRIHRWIQKQKGTPSLCEVCGTTETSRFEWANISQEYEWDVSDWKRMCAPCHRSYDVKSRVAPKPPIIKDTAPAPIATACTRGHEYNDENTYYMGNRRVCRVCRRVSCRAYKARVKLKKLSGANAQWR